MIEPHFPRPAPPTCFLDPQELVVLTPALFQADKGDAKSMQLLAHAIQSPLIPSQQQQILVALTVETSLVVQRGLTPHKLPELVENNPMIAVECLLKLTSSPLFPDYLSVLVNMSMSLHGRC